MTRISVYGLGKLGLPLAAVLANAGHDVIGVDVNKDTVDQVQIGISTVDEVGVQQLMDRSQGRLTATMGGAKAATSTEMSFIITPTPSETNGCFSNEFVLQAIDEIASGVAVKKDWHTVVVSSTVMPGSCDGEIRQRLEYSGREVGVDIGLCYSPEFIALGSVIHDMTNPDMVLIGESDPVAGKALQDVISTILKRRAPFQRMNLVNAEIAKIAVNTFVTMKISYANTLAEICERLPGADAAVVAGAIGHDTRVGKKYLRPATAFGGPCFPRDNRAFAALAQRLHVKAPLARATDHVNVRQVDRLVKRLAGVERLAILGLSYKPNTSVVEESVGVKLAQRLAGQTQITVYDPVAQDAAYAILEDTVRWAGTASGALAECDVAVICTPWEEFRDLQVPKPEAGSVLIIDCWDMIKLQPSWVKVQRVGQSQ